MIKCKESKIALFTATIGLALTVGNLNIQIEKQEPPFEGIMVITDENTGYDVGELQILTNNISPEKCDIFSRCIEKGSIFFDGNTTKTTCNLTNHQNECVPKLEENKYKIIEQLKTYDAQKFTYEIHIIPERLSESSVFKFFMAEVGIVMLICSGIFISVTHCQNKQKNLKKNY